MKEHASIPYGLIVVSPPRCGSTFVYNVCAEILSAFSMPLERKGYAERWPISLGSGNGTDVALWKTHDIQGVREISGVRVIFVFRDVLEQCLSGRKMFGWTFEAIEEQAEHAMKAQLFLEGKDVIFYHYCDESVRDEASVQELAFQILNSRLSKSDAEAILERVRGSSMLKPALAQRASAKLRTMARSALGRPVFKVFPPSIRKAITSVLPPPYDRTTLFHVGHRTSARAVNDADRAKIENIVVRTRERLSVGG